MLQTLKYTNYADYFYVGRKAACSTVKHTKKTKWKTQNEGEPNARLFRITTAKYY